MRARATSLVLFAAVVVGCGSSSSSSGADPDAAVSDSAGVSVDAADATSDVASHDAIDAHETIDPTVALAKYCTGTLKTEQMIRSTTGNEVWSAEAAPAPVGTTFLVTYEYGKWGGYVPHGAALPEKLDAGDGGLKKDVDFTSSCAIDGAVSHEVLLVTARIYEKPDLTGTPCVLDAGTEIHNWSFGSAGGSVSASCDEIKSTCGFASGSSRTFVPAPLIEG